MLEYSSANTTPSPAMPQHHTIELPLLFSENCLKKLQTVICSYLTEPDVNEAVLNFAVDVSGWDLFMDLRRLSEQNVHLSKELDKSDALVHQLWQENRFLELEIRERNMEGRSGFPSS